MQALMALPGVHGPAAGAGVARGGASARALAVDADLVLDFSVVAEVTLRLVTLRADRVLGTFANARDAWAAIDRIELDARCAAGRASAPVTTHGRR